MTTRDETPRVRRVVVLLDGSRHVAAMLDEAIAMAAREQAELVGLFIEDIDLLRAASLPFGGEIGMVSGRLRRVEPGSMERRMRYQVEQARRRLATAARPHAVRWRLEVNRDHVDTVTLAVAAEGDVLLLAGPGWRGRFRGGPGSAAARRIASGARCTVMLLGDRHAPQEQPVLVVHAPGAAGRRALAEAARMARGMQRKLVAIVPPALEHDAAALAELEQWDVRRHLLLDLAGSAEKDVRAVIRLLQREHAAALVVPRSHPLLEGGVGERLFDALETPLVVVP